MGGTDDASNLIEMSIEQHAEEHRLLYEQYGKEEDKIAWLALSGQASKQESMAAALRLGRQKTNEILEQRYGHSWRKVLGKMASTKSAESRQRRMQEDSDYANRVRQQAKKASDAALNDTTKQKRKDTFAKTKHQRGVKNSNFGNIWIYNTILQQSKLINKNDPIPDGWCRGRKIKF